MATSGITQPPLHAAAALEVYRHATDPPEALAFLERLYPKLVAQHAYLKRSRDPDRNGLAEIVHPWESGLDNSPAWDRALADLAIPPGAIPSCQRFDVVHADPAHRRRLRPLRRSGGDLSRRRLRRHSAAGPQPLPDPGAAVQRDLALVSPGARRDRQAGRRRPRAAPRRRQAIRQAILDQLWDRKGQRFGIRDVRCDQRTPEDTILAFVPLLDPGLPGRW